MTTRTGSLARSGSRARSKRGRVLPDDACPACGAIMRPARGSLSVSVNGESMAVPGLPHLRCPACGERMFGLGVARELERRAIDLYRTKYGLLAADEIKTLRQDLGLTQAELARLLRLGGNTISRWEAGRNVQSAVMDMLLRLIRDVPSSLEYLKSHAA
jgi:putative zinc finger/helix-turn-helix YgiT family protein